MGVYQVSLKEKRDIAHAFQMLDKDRDGTIAKDELKNAWNTYMGGATDDQVDFIFN